MKVSKADIFVYTNDYMEPWARSFLNGVPNDTTVVDTSRGVTLMKGAPEEEHEGEHGEEHHHHHGGMDPHIWLDFGNAQIMVDNILSAMVSKDPGNRDYVMRPGPRHIKRNCRNSTMITGPGSPTAAKRYSSMAAITPSATWQSGTGSSIWRHRESTPILNRPPQGWPSSSNLCGKTG